jgi:outer membrane protein OmpA-like peptidoglycan-associated protein
VVYDVSKKRIVPEKSYRHIISILDRKTGKVLNGVHAEINIDNVIDSQIINGYHFYPSRSQLVYGDTLSYKIKLSKTGYLTQEFNFSEQVLDKDSIVCVFALEPSEIGVDLAATLKMNTIYFDLNKSSIREDAQIELDKIVKIMNDNPEIYVELASHTDCRGTASYNLALSEKRALASAAYIQERISNPERIYGKGYGEAQLLNNCACEDKVKSKCSEKEHQKNRRTVFRIVKN